jgi:hypothetical protein
MDAEVFWDIREWAVAVAQTPVERDLLASYPLEPQSGGDRETPESRLDRSA